MCDTKRKGYDTPVCAISSRLNQIRAPPHFLVKFSVCVLNKHKSKRLKKGRGRAKRAMIHDDDDDDDDDEKSRFVISHFTLKLGIGLELVKYSL